MKRYERWVYLCLGICVGCLLTVGGLLLMEMLTDWEALKQSDPVSDVIAAPGESAGGGDAAQQGLTEGPRLRIAEETQVYTYEDMEQVKADEAKKLNTADTKTVDVKLNDLLWNMITVSDNESFNELVRLQTASGVFKDGAQAVNGFLAEQKFADTSVQHILSPSSSKDVGLGGRNTTSVKDCAELLSRIYKGECVSKEASEAMLNLLLNQQVTTKIPSGISVSVEIANKTGETDTDQHDIAIVYGEKTTYILCVMSEDCKPGDAVSHIRDISGIVYNYLNMDLDQG